MWSPVHRKGGHDSGAEGRKSEEDAREGGGGGGAYLHETGIPVQEVSGDRVIRHQDLEIRER
jgi:hypothetical protein